MLPEPTTDDSKTRNPGFGTPQDVGPALRDDRCGRGPGVWRARDRLPSLLGPRHRSAHAEALVRGFLTRSGWWERGSAESDSAAPAFGRWCVVWEQRSQVLVGGEA
jgi:hypothetical protein